MIAGICLKGGHMELLIGLICGAIGGNIAGGLLRNVNLGLFGNALDRRRAGGKGAVGPGR